VYSQSREPGQELDEVETAVVVALANLLRGNIVAAPADAGLDAFDVKFWSRKAHVPDINIETLR